MKISNFFYKLFHWEYWPAFMFYLPNIPLFIYLSFKAKTPVFFTATNPAIKYSGHGMESKFETLKLIPKPQRPRSILIKPNENFLTIENKLLEAEIAFPIIAKPEMGFRGMMVKKLNSFDELKNYLEQFKINIILQEFINLKNECGIFYSRIPGENSGTITSITLKKYLTVIGDGSSSISELILQDQRARQYFKILIPILKSKMNDIPSLGENIILTVIGNHSKGTQFIDGNHLISKELTQTIDNLQSKISGWNYGRIDLKFDSFDKLKKGLDYKIIEINGIISEPTHIYDASKNSYLDALNAIGSHWKIAYDIAVKNNSVDQIPYANTKEFISELHSLYNYTKKIKRLNF